MINLALYKREMKGSVKLLLIFGAILTMYVSVIITMYDPQMMKTLDSFAEVMPELMASVGMKTNAADLLGFMVSYLYGFILLIFPMLFCILRGNALIAKYVDRGSMALLAAAPVKRRTIAFTQMGVLVSGILLLVFYCTVLEVICAGSAFPGQLDMTELFALNGGLLCLHMFSFFLRLFRYKVQCCVGSRHSGLYVCAADACKCRRRCGKSEVFHVFYLVSPGGVCCR